MKTTTILVADDDAAIRRLLKRQLSGAGTVIVVAADGYEALARARDLRPEIVILDIEMPGLDGREVCRRLRADASTRGIGVLMLTALRGVEEEIEGLHCGADAYLTKPFELRELHARLNALLRRTKR